MQLDPTEIKPVVNRLKRAQGQLSAVVRMLEEGVTARTSSRSFPR